MTDREISDEELSLILNGPPAVDDSVFEFQGLVNTLEPDNTNHIKRVLLPSEHGLVVVQELHGHYRTFGEISLSDSNPTEPDFRVFMNHDGSIDVPLVGNESLSIAKQVLEGAQQPGLSFNGLRLLERLDGTIEGLLQTPYANRRDHVDQLLSMHIKDIMKASFAGLIGEHPFNDVTQWDWERTGDFGFYWLQHETLDQEVFMEADQRDLANRFFPRILVHACDPGDGVDREVYFFTDKALAFVTNIPTQNGDDERAEDEDTEELVVRVTLVSEEDTVAVDEQDIEVTSQSTLDVVTLEKVTEALVAAIEQSNDQPDHQS